MSATVVVHSCGCGRVHTWADWLKLEIPRNGEFSDGLDGNYQLRESSWRTCVCGSTGLVWLDANRQPVDEYGEPLGDDLTSKLLRAVRSDLTGALHGAE